MGQFEIVSSAARVLKTLDGAPYKLYLELRFALLIVRHHAKVGRTNDLKLWLKICLVYYTIEWQLFLKKLAVRDLFLLNLLVCSLFAVIASCLNLPQKV